MEQAQTTASTRSAIADEVEKVAKEQGKKLATLSDDLVLLDSGLDSAFCNPGRAARAAARFRSLQLRRRRVLSGHLR